MCDAQTNEPCGQCEACCAEDLPVNPFLALRVAYGMLLGENDFRTLMGNPRGKQMLHNAWLHGSGVVWGYPVQTRGTHELKVGPGLALDGWGRELFLGHTECLNVRDWVKALPELPTTKAVDDCHTRTIRACLYAEFDCCAADPVPTLADPCDVTRRHDDYSRVVELVRLVLRPEECREPWRPYHRVRVLFGLEQPWDEHDAAGWEAREAALLVHSAPAEDRIDELLRQLRCMAAKDSADLRPAGEPGVDECCEGTGELGLFPVGEDDADVPLACVTIEARNVDECVEIVDIQVEVCCRTALVPTATIQELDSGLAAGVFGPAAGDAEGPRVIPTTLSWDQVAKTYRVQVTKDLFPASLTKRAIKITSLSDRGWVDEDIDRVDYEGADRCVVIEMHDAPVYDTVRLSIRGTGPTPVFGAEPLVPLAGIVGGPPGTRHDGLDAVLTFSQAQPTEEGS